MPFFKGYYILFLSVGGFAVTYMLFTTFILVGTTNAVNITDGLDGLTMRKLEGQLTVAQQQFLRRLLRAELVVAAG